MDLSKISYDEAVKVLEQISREMESGEIGIDEVAEKLKVAQQLLKFCRTRLTGVEEEIGKILGEGQK